MRSVDGPAQAGDYVAIIVMGAAQVKVQDDETILAGQRLAAGVSTVVFRGQSILLPHGCGQTCLNYFRIRGNQWSTKTS